MPVAIPFAFPALWPAIAILLILWAAVYIFQKPLVALLSKLPVVGTAIAKAVGDAIGGLIAWATEWAASLVRPLVELVSAPIIWLVAVFAGIVATAEAIVAYVGRVALAAAGQVGSLATRLANLVATVIWLTTTVAGVQALAEAANRAIQALLTATLPAALDALRSWAVAQIAGAVTSLQAALALADAALRSWATAVIATTVLPLQAALAALPAWVQAQIAAAVAVVAGTLGIRIGGVEGKVAGLDGQVGTLGLALAPLIALELTRVVPRVIEDVNTMRRTCVDPTCRVIGPQLAALDALVSGTTFVLFAAFVAGAVADPAGSARTTAGEAGGLRSLSNDTLGLALGVQL